jgi:hypothetical protein
MTQFRLSSALTSTLVCAVASLLIYVGSHPGIVHAQGKSQFAPGQQSTAPSVVGTWFGIARPCPANAAADPAHVAFCQAVCGSCASIPGTLPPEIPMMSTIHEDGTVTASDTGSIPVFHTTAQGAWAADPDPNSVQVPGSQRYQASFIWFQSSSDQVVGPGVVRQFVGVARPRLVTYWDPTNPDNMIGYIQPYFFPIVGASGLVNVMPSPNFKGNLDVGNHYPVNDFLAQLPVGCQTNLGCLGTFHFTFHRVKANVPN